MEEKPVSSDIENQLKLARSRSERLKKARDEAERLLEQKSRELYQANTKLELAQKRLESDIKQATYELSVSNKRLQKALDERSTFIGQMSHEVRTPLNAVLGLSELLLSTDMQATQLDYVDTINSAARSLTVLLNDMLDITKIEAGKLNINLEPVDLKRIHNNVISMFNFEAQAKGLRLTLSLADNIPNTVKLDKGRYRQILNNLMSNALKNTQYGSIELAVDYTENAYSEGIGTLRVMVIDTGKGIPKHKLKTIFNAYEQLGISDHGVGLGLAICSQLCELMQGNIRCDSELGKGSSFEVRLPAESVENGVVSTASTSDIVLDESQTELKILVAEDNPINQKVLQAQLAQLGQSATIVNNGAEAIASLQENCFDLVLLDNLMPVMDGEQTIRAIRDSGPQIAEHYCVALTASNYQDQRERLLSLGFDGFLAKPLSLDELTRALKAVMSRGDVNKPHYHQQAAVVSQQPDSFDFSFLRSQFGDLCETIFIEIAPTFLEHTVGDVNRLAKAVANGEAESIRKISHSMKGGVLSLGLNELAAKLERLEAQAETSMVHDWFEEIELLWQTAETNVVRELNRLNQG